MDGEVAQAAALTISANHRVAHPGDPMPWFATQRAFDRCGSIAFHTEGKRRFGKDRRVPVAETPSGWLERLETARVTRVVLSCTRQDKENTIPDRLSAGFAGGGSLWAMTSETSDGGAIRWVPGWRAAFPRAEDGRIWAVEYLAEPAVPVDSGPSVNSVAALLVDSLAAIHDFARQHQFNTVAAIFASALALLAGGADPRPVPRPPGPADVLSPDARNLLFAAQRAWVFDNLSLWRDQDFSQDTWRDYARLSEVLYNDVTAAMVAAVNASCPKS